jgi:hypothetical protein
MVSARTRDLLLGAGRPDALVALGRVAEFERLDTVAQERVALRVIAAFVLIEGERPPHTVH